TLVFCPAHGAHRVRPSFPTRRSSDLGMSVRNSDAPISVPVGAGTLGRIMDVLGRPIDERGPIETDEVRAIHQKPPKFDELSHSVDRKSTRLNSSHVSISYAVFCLKKK